MKAKDIKYIFHKKLDAIFGSDEVEQFFFLSIEHYLGVTRIQLALDTEFTFSEPEDDIIFKVLDELKQQKPIQYILEETEFYGLKFKVNKNVLIPRPETEELVAQIIANSKSQRQNSNPIAILDIGTGSGCIAITLAKHLLHTKVYALDISHKAIDIAKENAKLNEVDVTFFESDILNEPTWDTEFENLKFDLIISNPPYVRQLEKEQMKPNVLENEPHLALFVDNENPLEFYKAITNFASKHLKHNGELFFEINQYLGEKTKALLTESNFKFVELKKDLSGNDRFLKGIKF